MYNSTATTALICFLSVLLSCTSLQNPSNASGRRSGQSDSEKFDLDVAKGALARWIVESKDPVLEARPVDIKEVPQKVIIPGKEDELQYKLSSNCYIWMGDRIPGCVSTREIDKDAYSGEFKRRSDGDCSKSSGKLPQEGHFVIRRHSAFRQLLPILPNRQATAALERGALERGTLERGQRTAHFLHLSGQSLSKSIAWNKANWKSIFPPGRQWNENKRDINKPKIPCDTFGVTES